MCTNKPGLFVNKVFSLFPPRPTALSLLTSLQFIVLLSSQGLPGASPGPSQGKGPPMSSGPPQLGAWKQCFQNSMMADGSWQSQDITLSFLSSQDRQILLLVFKYQIVNLIFNIHLWYLQNNSQPFSSISIGKFIKKNPLERNMKFSTVERDWKTW